MAGLLFIGVIFVILYILYFYNPHHYEVIMVKGKLERKYKLIHNGRELSKGLLSEAGKFDAMQILVQRFDEGRPDAIDPDEVEIIDMSLKENQ